jgi:hypothetical protein
MNCRLGSGFSSFQGKGDFIPERLPGRLPVKLRRLMAFQGFAPLELYPEAESIRHLARVGVAFCRMGEQGKQPFFLKNTLR